MKVIYCCVPSHGHMDWGGVEDMLGELQSRGHHITVASGQYLRHRIQQQGFEFLDLGLKPIEPRKNNEQIDFLLEKHRNENFFSIQETKIAIKRLKDYLGNKNCILITDSYFKAPAIVAHDLDMDYYCVKGPRREIDESLRKKIAQQAKQYLQELDTGWDELDPDYPVVITRTRNNIYFSSRKLSQEYGEETLYAGGKELENNLAEFFDAYYSSGTLFWDKQQVDAVLDLFSDFNVVCSTGGGVYYAQHSIPFASELEAMKKSKVIITQGGMGTLHKAMRLGKPVIVLPLFFGNLEEAKQIVAYGNGIVLEAGEQHKLLQSLHKVLKDESYLIAAKGLQKELHNSWVNSALISKIENGIFISDN